MSDPPKSISNNLRLQSELAPVFDVSERLPTALRSCRHQPSVRTGFQHLHHICKDNVAPPTLNLDNPDEGTEGVDLVPKQAKQREVRAALNNSFGFGGTNASLIVQKVD